MDALGIFLVVFSNWIVFGSVLLDLLTDGAFCKWKVRRSVTVALVSCFFWPLMWYHVSHQGAKF